MTDSKPQPKGTTVLLQKAHRERVGEIRPPRIRKDSFLSEQQQSGALGKENEMFVLEINQVGGKVRRSW